MEVNLPKMGRNVATCHAATSDHLSLQLAAPRLFERRHINKRFRRKMQLQELEVGGC